MYIFIYVYFYPSINMYINIRYYVSNCIIRTRYFSDCGMYVFLYVFGIMFIKICYWVSEWDKS